MEQLGQLALALKTGRDETENGMGLHRISQLNDIEAAGGVASFCELLNTDVESMQIVALEMVGNLIALQNGAGNELAAGESVAQSGACAQLVKMMGSRALNLHMGKSMRPEVEQKALRVVFHICKSPACQKALRRAGGATRLLELLSSDSPAALETRVEAARCLKRFVRKSPENIVELTANKGVALLCGLLGDFIEMRSTSSAAPATMSSFRTEGYPRDESYDVAIEAILSTICECIHLPDMGGALTPSSRAVAQIPAGKIQCFVSVLQNGDHVNRMLASQVLTQASREPSLVAIMAGETEFIKELTWMLDSHEDYITASEILHGMCSTPLKQTEGANGTENAHEKLLRVIFDTGVFALVLDKLNGCVIGNDQFVGEIRFQENLLGITKSFSAEPASYADFICSKECVRTLSAFLLSPRKQPLVPLCAQTLMNLCEFNPGIFDELYDRNASDFFHRMLQTPPDENRLSALRYFQSLMNNGRCFSVGVLDTLFLMASGRDPTLKAKSLEVIGQLSCVKSIGTILEPLEEPATPEFGNLVVALRDRVVGAAYFPVIMTIATSPGNGEMRANAIKCIRCAIDGGDDFVLRMLDQEMLRAFWLGMRRSMDTPVDSLSPTEAAVNKALVQLLYLVLKSPAPQIDSIIGDQVENLASVVTEFIVSQPSRLSMGIRIIRVLVGHESWKGTFFTLLVDSSTMGLKFMEALMNGIEQSSAKATEKGQDAVFDDSIEVLKELVEENENDPMVNLVISARVHISLLEFLKEDASIYVVETALDRLDTLTKTRRIRLLILEAGESLQSLVSMYETTTREYAESDPERQQIARQIGKILVHLSTDPLEFRKTLYDHRATLPRVILGNILSPIDDVSTTAEDVVLNLVESDFATCPLWIDLIEKVNVQLVFQVMVVAKRSSVQVTAVRKLVDIVFSHPEVLNDEETGLSAVEKGTLITMLITFFVDFDPRTSVVGVLALALLLKNGQALTDEQMEKIAVDGAVSLVYWIQKGTERHQENAVNILSDGVTDPAVMRKFFEQLQSPAVQRDTAFITELSLQLLDGDVKTNASGMLKRCKLLVGILELTDLESQSKECLDTIDELAGSFFTLLDGPKQGEGGAVVLEHEFVMNILKFLQLVIAFPPLRAKIIKKSGLDKVVGLFKVHKHISDDPESRAIASSSRSLIKDLCVDDIPRLVSLNVIDILLETDDATEPKKLSDVVDLLDTMNAIAECGVSGKMALMEADGILQRLEEAFTTIMAELSTQDGTPDMDAFLSDDGTNLKLACGIASLVLDLARRYAYREQILLMSGLCVPVVSLMEWFPSVFQGDKPAATTSPELVDAFCQVFTTGLPFLEAALVSEQQLPLSIEERGKRLAKIGRVFTAALSTFADGHKSSKIFILACESLVVLYQNPHALNALDDETRNSLENLLKEQGLRSLKAEVYSLECVVALLELAELVIPSVTRDEDIKSYVQRQSWIVAVVLHALFKLDEWSETLDASILVELLRRFCASYDTRAVLYDHVEYPRLLEVLGELASGEEWRRYRRHAVRVLAMLGEEDTIQHASESLSRRQSSAALVNNGRSEPDVHSASVVRCFHCRQSVHIPPKTSLSAVLCPYCQKPIAVAPDVATASVNRSPSVTEVDDDKGNAGGDGDAESLDSARAPSPSVSNGFTCVNCSKSLDIPNGISVSEVVCPHCMNLAAVKTTSNGALPALSDHGSVESGESTPRNNEGGKASLSGIDVRDTKVVSCGHCGKHLIVKNGASAVKCPSCHGVSKLSTTTSTCPSLLSFPCRCS